MTLWTHAWRTLLCGALIGTLNVIGGCTWVKLSDAGALVQPTEVGAIATCQRVGIVTTQTQSKVVVSRGDTKVREELLVLARNEAAALGADTIVAIGRPGDGRQDFEAYLCGPDSSD
jgi:hypothetical protein